MSDENALFYRAFSWFCQTEAIGAILHYYDLAIVIIFANSRNTSIIQLRCPLKIKSLLILDEIKQGKEIVNHMSVSEYFEPFSIDETNQSLAEAFDKAAQKYSDCVAIHTDEKEFSYRELDQLTSQLAHRILDLLGDEEEPVAILVDQRALQIISILSVLKAGKIYTVLELSNPPERLAAMINDLGSRLTMTSSAQVSLAGSVSGSSALLLNMDTVSGGDARVLIHRLPQNTAGDYCTSG